jgi:hypothetical protein
LIPLIAIFLVQGSIFGQTAQCLPCGPQLLEDQVYQNIPFTTAYDSDCEVLASWKVRRCGNNYHIFDMVFAVPNTIQCAGFLAAQQDAKNQGPLVYSYFMNDVLDQLFRKASEFIGTAFATRCNSSPGTIAISSFKGSCISFCEGIDANPGGLLEDYELTRYFVPKNCGIVCCSKSINYCKDINGNLVSTQQWGDISWNAAAPPDCKSISGINTCNWEYDIINQNGQNGIIWLDASPCTESCNP